MAIGVVLVFQQDVLYTLICHSNHRDKPTDCKDKGNKAPDLAWANKLNHLCGGAMIHTKVRLSWNTICCQLPVWINQYTTNLLISYKFY
ncbi:hypothetical protein A3B21_04185 [Candidatus Uhrbacteria bacterium RIFCSPLOWO2_01_FULL_47_24]|uniref:Uncharacterized protein n=1 Tax=Candidatus Uhrbacteria bacterium RIFCSPLOWO2_01_FULL_47_24 TaxID=1802401 RepID=A0A1F7UTL0_9BACT|nr:MAG: hypothetical protein A2753_02500 [Candidatus Uhrbacteria bacterium RIFCSPHIGHO2_01_FULL_47_11]OGL68784.1 MAG: hypothetical protein A3D58_01390 [Candidatus Uhrbacteria bacterium RIFCSPHIGHO2_02_FULL_46_47]OGL75246.1 MAG: hypothetical protein A3F52_05070 [Candidatus Uhrbacteria bacterium RIFCSPHIGHO2_12_FULL_47_11]OGL81589.1 MAG: hypothetical protein A3B21_04185 [Candidatus Uhrbacteria bacterium RIFCSPLOWO2_01_FULL_47_24]OGL83971.1 MAG: hypothetical protein A3J03_00950 [Candidatus Uhrbact